MLLLHGTTLDNFGDILVSGRLAPPVMQGAEPNANYGDGYDPQRDAGRDGRYPFFVFFSPVPPDFLALPRRDQCTLGFETDILVGKDAYSNLQWSYGTNDKSVTLNTESPATVDASLDAALEPLWSQSRGPKAALFRRKFVNVASEMGEVLVRQPIDIRKAVYLRLKWMPKPAMCDAIRATMPRARIVVDDLMGWTTVGAEPIHVLAPLRPARMYARPAAPLQKDMRVAPVFAAAKRARLRIADAHDIWWTLLSNRNTKDRLKAAAEPLANEWRSRRLPGETDKKFSRRTEISTYWMILYQLDEWMREYRYDGYASPRFIPEDTDAVTAAMEMAAQYDGDVAAAGHAMLVAQVAARAADLVAGDISAREFVYSDRGAVPASAT
jgi:hypothetical protein